MDPLGNEVQTVYNEFNQPQVELDELGLPTAYEYDERGNQTAVVTPDGSAVQVDSTTNGICRSEPWIPSAAFGAGNTIREVSCHGV